MSIKAISLVWERSQQSGSDLLLMLAIADYAKDDGTGAWPSLTTLAKKARMTRGNAIRRLQKLEEDGEIIVHRGEGPHGVNFYDIDLPASSVEATRVVAPTPLEIVAPTPPNPSFEPSPNRGELPAFDYLTDVVNRKLHGQNGKSGIAVPQDDAERWLQYQDEALAKYHELTGLYPDSKIGKAAISDLAALPDFDLDRWDASIRSCRLAGVNPGNIGCIIDTYKDGGDYRAMKQHERERERGQSPGKQEKPTIIIENGKRTRVIKG